jgi:hypothetical protein
VLERLDLPIPAANFPLVWEPGDTLELRPRADLEARVAVLNIVLARSFGMHPEQAMRWLDDARLVDHLSPPERRFVERGEGDQSAFVLHLEAVYALGWVLGIGRDLDPRRPSDDGLVARLPNLPEGETYAAWRARTLTAPRAPTDVAALLDLYYCLDWAYLAAERHRLPLPGTIDSNAIGQRRWALEWAVIFHGPYHDPPVAWEEVDLTL